MDKKISSERQNERGAVALLMAVAMVGLIGVASLAVDIGMALVAKSELQNVADAASLAATRELSDIYKKDPSKISQTLSTSDRKKVADRAKEYAALNKAGGISISVADDDVCIGHYTMSSGDVTCPDYNKVRLAQITGRRDDTSNGVLPTQLATVLGINSMSVRATTAAALTPLKKLNTGTGDFPIGISRTWFDSHVCGQGAASTIKLFPASEGDSCAGWHTFTEKPASANRLGSLLNQMLAGEFKSPETIAGETYYEFIGGNVESRCNNLRNLYLDRKVGNTMTANIPVYDMDCGNVQQDRKILGFARAKITGITCHPTTNLSVEVDCGVVGEEIGEGGGAYDYGFLAASPSMVY